MDVILTTSFDYFRAGDPRHMDAQKLCMTLRGTGGIQRVACQMPSMSSFMSIVLGACWPIFAWKVRVGEGDISSNQRLVDGFLLVTWSVAANLKRRFESTEDEMRSLAYLTIKDDQRRFAQLINFRRGIGKCYDDLERWRQYVDYTLQCKRAGGPFELDRRLTLQRREDLKKPIRAHLTDLEKKPDAVKEDLNEEIQVAIATVQVREAQLTRLQTQVTARQTTWTVALTVLAAVYLPMTLVTGIFGMNITEISSEATAPNAWWAVGAWVVIVLLTVAGILSYVAINKRRARKKKADLEANEESEERNSKGKVEAGKGLGKDSKGWVRKVKQKAKTVWTHKQE